MPVTFDPVCVAPIADQNGATFGRLVEIMRTLLSESGCPWDREQTFASLRRYVLEEACEVIDAIDSGDMRAVREELGDLLLQVVFQAELGRRQQLFGPDDVVKGICDKLVRRHPHVFAESSAANSAEVLANWERIKAGERSKEGGAKGVLSSVPKALPALVRAQRVGEKVNRVGFDWPGISGSREKVAEEIGELDQAISSRDQAGIEEEFGDVLFALVNLARHAGVDAESALRRTTNKFVRRFEHVERRVRENHGGFAAQPPGTTLPLPMLDAYWQEAKTIEGCKDPNHE